MQRIITSQIRVSIDKQDKLFNIATEIFEKQEVDEYLLQEFRKSISPDLFVSNNVQVCYDEYSIIRKKLTKQDVDVPEIHAPGSLILLRIMLVVLGGEEKMNELLKYDEISELSREKV